MKFSAAKIPGVWLIDLELRVDERGFFARTFCENEFSAHGLNTKWPQCNLTLTKNRGMLRGLHFQAEPKPEIKLIRCSAGAVFDVLVDLRKDSPTYSQWEAFELRAEKHQMLYVPAGIAHGFQCLSDQCEMYYQMSEFYSAGLSSGIRWDDPKIGIAWPIPSPIVSERDAKLPFLS